MTLTATQIDQRVTYIGASEAAAVLGLSRWKTPLQVWAEKVGRIEPKDISDKMPVRVGNLLEDAVATLFMEETGKKVHRVNETKFHKVYPFLGVNLDRRVVGEDAVLEIKTCSSWKAKEWAGEEIPAEYILQVYHQLAVTGASKGYIAVLIGNQDFKYKEILRDEKIINSIVAKEVRFWNTYIVPKEMPMTVTENDGDTLFELFPIADPNNDVLLGDDVNILIEQIEATDTEKDLLEKDLDRMKNELKLLLGPNEHGQSTIYRVSWKNQTSKRIDTERIKTDMPTIYSAYLKESRTRVLRFNRKEK